MLGKLFKQLKNKKPIEARDWTRNNRIIQSGVANPISFTR